MWETAQHFGIHVFDAAYGWSISQDLSTACLAVALLCWFGSKFVQQQTYLHAVGLICGGITVVGWMLLGITQGEIEQATDLWNWVIASGIVGGLVTGLLWLGLPACVACGYLLLLPFRFAGYGIWQMLCLCMQGFKSIGHWWQDRTENLSVTKTAEVQLQTEAESDRQQRRLNAARNQYRLQCELAYNARFEQLKEQLPREAFQQILDNYLQTATSRKQLEIQAEMILAMLQRYGSDPGNTSEPNLSKILAFFDQQAEEVRQANLDSDTLDSLLTNWNQQRIQAIQEYWNHVSRRTRT
jgi:hypothetical protein